MWGEHLRTTASAKPHIPETSVDEPPPDPSFDDESDETQHLGLPEPTTDIFREGSTIVASAQPSILKPSVDELPPDPSTDDDDDDETQDLGLPPTDIILREGSGIVASSQPDLPEPTVDEPPPSESITDDEDEDASPDKENQCDKVNCEMQGASLDVENDFHGASRETPLSKSSISSLEDDCDNLSCETPLSGSSKSSLSFASVLTPASEQKVAVYTEDVALRAEKHCLTKYSECDDKCFLRPEHVIDGGGHTNTEFDFLPPRLNRYISVVVNRAQRGFLSAEDRRLKREPPSALSPRKVVGAYAGWFPPETAVSAASNTEFYALASFLKAPRPSKTRETHKLLRSYGYRGISRGKDKLSDPLLSVSLAHHFERAGFTWYELKCSLRQPERASGNADGIVWVVHRRLAMLRQDLHHHIKSELGKVAYSEAFGNSHFPARGGLPGTSARLKKWLATLTKWINSGKAPLFLIAHVLKFLELPAVARRVKYVEEVDEEGEDALRI